MVQFSLKEAHERGRVEERDRIIRLLENAEDGNDPDFTAAYAIQLIESTVE